MPESQWLPKKDFLEALHLTDARLKKLRQWGGPAPQREGKAYLWPLEAWAEFLLVQPLHGHQDPETLKRARDVIQAQRGQEPSKAQPPDSPAAETSLDALPADDDSKLGLEAALGRLRDAERRTYRLWCQAVDEGDPSQAQAFKSWQLALDQLRKAEGSLLDVLERRRELLPSGEVKLWMSRQIEAAKATLLDLPGKLAPALESLPWPEIQKTLDAEVRHALAKLSENPE